jgi:hypothetical protein
MSIPAALLAEMRGLNRVHATAELTLGGSVYRYSAETAVDSESIGDHVPTLLSMAEFSRQSNFSEFSLQVPTPAIEIFDYDRTLQALFGGPLRGAVDGSVVSCWRRSKHVPAASHYEFFDGVILSHGLSRDRTYRFTLSPNVSVLEGNPKIPYLTRTDFPNAPSDFIDQPLWIVYGTHSSSGVAGAKGMIRCLPTQVDVDGNCVEWVVSYGQSTSVQRLFRGGTQNDAIEDTSNWGFYPLERGGHRYQMAHYSGGNPKPAPEDYIAVDMNGLFQDGPTSTASQAIRNPAAVIRNFLAHFGYGDGDVRSSVAAYESEVGHPIATDVFDSGEDYFDVRGDVCDMVVRADETVLDVFNRWCESFNAGALWDDGWRIGAIPEDESELDIYTPDHVRQDQLDAIDEIQGDNSRSRLVSEVTVNYLLSDSLDALTASGVVSDPSSQTVVREAFDMEYGKAEAF